MIHFLFYYPDVNTIDSRQRSEAIAALDEFPGNHDLDKVAEAREYYLRAAFESKYIKIL